MKIVVLTGSAHRNGTSACLADEFTRGAKEAGHEVFRFDCAFEKVHPCTGCDSCRRAGGDGKCIFDDSMTKLNPALLEADMIVFATPVYYFGMTAQLKAVIDRFYANNEEIMAFGKKAVLLACAADDEPSTITPLVEHYRALCRYLRFEEKGMVLALGCADREDLDVSDFPYSAYLLGQSLV